MDFFRNIINFTDVLKDNKMRRKGLKLKHFSRNKLLMTTKGKFSLGQGPAGLKPPTGIRKIFPPVGASPCWCNYNGTKEII